MANESVSSRASQQEAEFQAMLWCELGLTWFDTGNDRDALACYERGEQVLHQACIHSGSAWARVRYEQGYVYWRQGSYEEARSKAFEALRLFKEVLERQKHPTEYQAYTTSIQHSLAGDPLDLGRTYQLLGLISVGAGLSHDALRYYTSALMSFEVAEYYRGIAIVCNNLGDLYLRNAEHELAYNALSRSLQISERTGNIPLLSVVLDNVGLLTAKRGNVVEAETYYRRGLSLIEQSDDQVDTCWLSIHLAMTLQDQARFAEAREALRHSLVIGSRMHINPCIAAALVAIGCFRIAQIRAWHVWKVPSPGIADKTRWTLEKARKNLQHALALEDIEKETRIEGQVLLAQTLLLQGKLDLAQQQVLYALDGAHKYEFRHLTAAGQRVLGGILLRQRNYEQAYQAFEQALEAFRKYGTRLEQARTLQSYGIALLQSAMSDKATAQKGLAYLREAHELSRNCQAKLDLQVVEHMLAKALTNVAS